MNWRAIFTRSSTRKVFVISPNLSLQVMYQGSLIHVGRLGYSVIIQQKHAPVSIIITVLSLVLLAIL